MPFLTACGATPVVILDGQPAVKAGGDTFLVSLAETPKEQQQGLMYREEMPQNEGMLFLFEREIPHNFWMKNTLIPLDIVWLDGEKRVIEVMTMQPCKVENCPSDGPKAASLYVLEVNAGAFHGRVGEVVEFINIPQAELQN